MTEVKYASHRHPYLVLTGELCGFFCEDFGASWPRYNSTALYQYRVLWCYSMLIMWSLKELLKQFSQKIEKYWPPGCPGSPSMMTSSNGNIFHVTSPLCGNSPVSGEFPSQRPVALMFPLICAWINRWVNNHEAGDLRCHRAHYGVIVMTHWSLGDVVMVIRV